MVKLINFNFIHKKTTIPVAVAVDFNSGADVGTEARRILAGQSNNMVAIWASSTASRTSGKMYVISTGSGAALSVVDLDNLNLYDRYTISTKGRAGVVLTQEDPVDIVV